MKLAGTEWHSQFIVDHKKGWIESMGNQRLVSLLGLVCMLIFVSACNANTDQESHQENHQQKHANHQEKNISTDPLKVDIDMPDKLPLNQESLLKARLTQGKEHVDDAQEVQFEIWKENHKKQSEMIDAKLEKEGVYTAKKTFQEDGIYYIQAHATARGMHVMPVKRVVVGKGEKEKESTSQEQSPQQEHHHH